MTPSALSIFSSFKVYEKVTLKIDPIVSLSVKFWADTGISLEITEVPMIIVPGIPTQIERMNKRNVICFLNLKFVRPLT